MSHVTSTPAAAPDEALAHFRKRLGFETDCWDVYASLRGGADDFVLLDVRSASLYAKGHVPGAIHLPHGKITEARMSDWPANTVFVVYCAGPHCNGANKGAIRLAELGQPAQCCGDCGAPVRQPPSGFSASQSAGRGWHGPR